MPLSDMTDSHLRNTIAFLKRRATEGVWMRQGGGSDPEDFWYEEWQVFGADALKVFGFRHYCDEAKRRWGDKEAAELIAVEV